MKPQREKETKKPGKTGLILFTIAVFSAFLALIVIRRELVSISFNSLYTAILLLLESPDKLREIFTVDIIEFWIGSVYLVGIPFIVLFLFIRSSRKKSEKKESPQMEELSLGKISLRAFRRNPIAMFASSVIFILYSAAFLAPFIAPFNPFDQQDFLVTAYQPPLTRLEALVMKDPKNLSIPLQTGNTPEIRLANSLINDFQALRTRNELHALKFVNEYRIDGEKISYRQGIRNKEMPVANLVNPETATQARPAFVRTRTFILGTDQYGRDILSRVIYGSRISLSIGFLVVLISVTLGTVIGVSSGYFGGWIDAVTMRIVDVLIAFPALFLILIIIATFGNSIYLIVTTLSFTGWMGVSRIVRSQVLSLKEQEFILAARSLGLSNMRIIFRHLVPNTLTPVIIAATLRIGSIILTEAGLSFLGLGVQPPVPSWGNIINEGRDSLLNYWWISTFPGIAILSTVVCFNLIGDGVRDALDPRMRG
jgi:peptide/nickel transport system permease protein